MAKAIRNLSVFYKMDVTRSIRNISSQELHSALGKISVVNGDASISVQIFWHTILVQILPVDGVRI